jgi:F-type H+-transporting ATPase subunit gamma
MAKGIREMRRRIQSVSNTEQITKTMKMVSAAKLRRAEAAAYQARDYTDAVMSVVNRVISQMDKSELSHPFLQENTNGKTAIIVITSDRGLCGAFNGTSSVPVLKNIRKQPI